ncbi:MAG: FadR/GntR family transcriptional regulator [Marinosulfonomonas sp.]
MSNLSDDFENQSKPSSGANRLEYSVYDELHRRISAEIYELGHRLPTENELSSEFQVSRPVIRAALARLRDDGLIVSRRGAGSFVARDAASEEHGFTPLRSINDISAYWDFRALIESEACAKAAERSTKADIDRLRAIHAEILKAIEKQESTVDLNTQLHVAISEIAQNHFFDDTIRLLTPHMEFVAKFLRSLSRETYQRNKYKMHDEHEAIINAIEARDQDAARHAMVSHINTSQRRIFKGN